MKTVFLFIVGCAVAGTEPVADETPLTLTRVESINPSFNPTLGQFATIRFTLSRDAQVTIHIYGPNGELVCDLRQTAPAKKGPNQVDWDGRDIEGAVVPDEAYFFTVTASAGGQTAEFDPLVHSGGERVTAQELTADRPGRLTYTLPRPCRVLVRAAVEAGPLLRTVVNWRPRPTGLCLEQWDGMDADGLRHLSDIEGVRYAVMAFALAEHSMITTGNSDRTYMDYYTSVGADRPRHRLEAPVGSGRSVLSPHWGIPVHLNRDPILEMRLVTEADTSNENKPASADAAVITSDTVLVRLDIPDPVEKGFMNSQRFEVVVYVDDRRVLEVEQGFLPFTYPWDVSGLKPGRHVFTLNVAGYRNHVGTASRLVDIKR